MIFYGKTDVGKRRQVNQDNFLLKKYSDEATLALVCDGMGGAVGGNIASRLALHAFLATIDMWAERYPELFGMSAEEVTAALADATDAANRAVYRESCENEDLSGMGTTLVGCVVLGEKMYVVNVGDSRLYAVEQGKIKQVSHDHSYVQYLVDMGKMTPEEAKNSTNKNLITRAVGTESTVDGDVFFHSVFSGDRVVICSDGLTNHVEAEEIRGIVEGADTPEAVQASVEALIDLANSRGGLDNITAVVLSL